MCVIFVNNIRINLTYIFFIYKSCIPRIPVLHKTVERFMIFRNTPVTGDLTRLFRENQPNFKVL